MGFSQLDPKWSTIRLGNSPYTMGDSGCLVTATADGLNRHGVPMDPKKLVTALNKNHSFQDPLGYLIFQGIQTVTGHRLVEGKHPGALFYLCQVKWFLRSGRITKHWVEDLGKYRVLDPIDGKGKDFKQMIKQKTWVDTKRRLSVF